MLRRQGLAGLSRVTPLSQGVRSGYSSSLGGRIKRDPELAAPHHEAFGVWALFRKSATRGVMGQHTRARHYATSTAVTPTEKESILGQLEKAHKHKEEGTRLQIAKDFAGARNEFQQWLTIKEEIFGEYHDGVAEAQQAVGDTYLLEDDFESSYKHYKNTLEIVKRLHGDTHPRVIECLNLVINSKERMGEEGNKNALYDALKLAEEVARISEKMGGTRKCKPVMDAFCKLGDVHFALGNNKKALEYLEEAGHWYLENQGYGDLSAMMCWNNIWSLYETTNQKHKLKVAKEIHRKCERELWQGLVDMGEDPLGLLTELAGDDPSLRATIEQLRRNMAKDANGDEKEDEDEEDEEDEEEEQDEEEEKASSKESERVGKGKEK